MAKILVLGAGVMGSAFTIPIADLGHAVHLVGTCLERHLVHTLRATHNHTGLKAPLPPSVRFFQDTELKDACADTPDLVVLGVSSAGVDWALEQLRSVDLAVPVIMLTKGLDVRDGKITTYPKHLSQRLGLPVGAIGGPCIAGELSVRRDTSAMVGFDDAGLASRFAAELSTPYYHLRPTTDLTGLELCAALKNLMAIGIGAAQGWLDLHGEAANGAKAHNLAAGLFSQAMRELQILNAALGGTDQTVFDLPGIGDLYVTVQGGRNARMGRLLGAGWRYSRAKAERMAGDTVEGAELALHVGPAMRLMMLDGNLKRARLRLTSAILDAVLDNQPFRLDWRRDHLDGMFDAG